MAYNPPRTAEQFEQMRAFFARDIAQASVALSQLVRERNIRMMGAIRSTGDTPKDQVRMVSIAHKVVNVAWAYLWAYYMPIFARYWSLRARYEREGNTRKLRDHDMKLMQFAPTYSLYQVAHEAGMTVFDMKFDQYHTISTMLGTEDKDEDAENLTKGVTWVAADATRIESKTMGQQIARHENPTIATDKKSRFPSFGEAIMLAKEQMTLLLGTEPTTEPPKPASRPPKKKSTPLRQPAPKREEEVLMPDGSNTGN